MPPTLFCGNCTTECKDYKGHDAEIRVIDDTEIRRWTRGCTLKAIIAAETFPDPHYAALAGAAIMEAGYKWKEVAVKIKVVHRQKRASFRIMYSDAPPKPGVLAKAFFPTTGRAKKRTLFLYPGAFADENRDYLAGILAHELGHVQGLRHEFETQADGSIRLGRKNRRSVMNYLSDIRKLRVGRQDRKELAMLYSSHVTRSLGLRIKVLDAPRTRYEY